MPDARGDAEVLPRREVILGDTIAAIATAPGRGGVAVIRVSGSESFQVAERLTGEAPEPGRVCLRKIGVDIDIDRVDKGIDIDRANADISIYRPYSPHRRLSASIEPIDVYTAIHRPFLDEAVVICFKGPRSYTGEDVVEFQCHGGTVTPRRVLEACLAAGARLARRGEFTERAFLNGKLDYDQAESVLDLIDAKTVRAADAALEGLAGRRRRELRSLYERALDLSTRLEHALDVDEGELADEYVRGLRARGEELRVEIASALRKAHEGRILRTGALVVLAGPPNAGKSSLMNALLEENRAIVSDVPGTTRDSIEEWLDLDGWPIRLVDTAGLRATTDEVEGEGVKRAEELVSKADVVLMLRSCDVEKLRMVNRTCQPLNLSTSQLLNVTSKCDLGRGPGLNVSAKTGEGLDELKRAIVAKLEEKAGALSGDADIESHDVAALQEAMRLLLPNASDAQLESNNQTIEQSNNPLPDLVLLANGVRAAAERLGAAIGATYSADLLDNLFSRFCVGK